MNARVDRGELDLDVPYLKATCGRDAEYALAQMLQTYGNLGGAAVKDIWPLRQGTEGGCIVRFANDSAKLRVCVEEGVLVSIQGFAPSALPQTKQAITVGNVALCSAVARRSASVTDAASLNSCATYSAILLEHLQKARGRDDL